MALFIFAGLVPVTNDRGTFWNLSIPTTVVAGDGAMSALSVYQHLSVWHTEGDEGTPDSAYQYICLANRAV